MNSCPTKGIVPLFSGLILPSDSYYFFLTIMPIISEIQILAIFLYLHIIDLKPSEDYLIGQIGSVSSILSFTNGLYYQFPIINWLLWFFSLIGIVSFILYGYLILFCKAVPISLVWSVRIILITYRDVLSQITLIYFNTIRSNEMNLDMRSSLPFIDFSAIIWAIMLGLIGATFCFSPFRNDGIFSCRSPIHIQLLQIIKVLISFLIPYKNLHIVTICLGMVVCIYRLVMMLRKWIYYDLRAMKFMTTICVVRILICLFGIINYAVQRLNATNLIITEILLISFIIRLSLQYSDQTILREIQKGPLSSINCHIFKKISYLGSLKYRLRISLNEHEKQYCNEEMMRLLGVIAEKFKVNETPITSFSLNDLQSEVTAISDSIINSILDQRVSLEKDCDLYKLVYLHDVLNKNRILTAILIFRTIKVRRLSFLHSLLYYIIFERLEKQMKIKLKETNEFYLPLVQVVNYEAESKKLQDMIISNVQKYLEFWEHYKEQDVSLLDLKRLSIEIEQQSTNIDNLMEKFSERHISGKSMIFSIYYSYLILIRNAPYGAMKINKKITLHETLKLFEEEEKILSLKNITDLNNVVLYVEMAKENPGRILYANQCLSEKFQWSSDEIIGKNIKLLMAPHMQKCHDILFQDIDNENNSLLTLSMQKAFIRSKTGCYLNCSMIRNIYPHIKDDLVYILVIKCWPEERHSDYLVITENGAIESYTKNICRNFGLDEKIYSIREITSDFQKIELVETENSIEAEGGSTTPAKFSREKSGFGKYIDQETPSEIKRTPKKNISYSAGGSQTGSLNETSRYFKDPTKWASIKFDSFEESKVYRMQFKGKCGIIDYDVSFKKKELVSTKYMIASLIKRRKRPLKELKKKLNFQNELFQEEDEGIPEELNSPVVTVRLPSDIKKNVKIVDSDYTTTPCKTIPSTSFVKSETLNFTKSNDQSSSNEEDLSSADVQAIKEEVQHRRNKYFEKLVSIDNQSVRSAKARTNVKEKIQEVVYNIPRKKSMGFVLLFVSGFIVLSLALLVYFYENTVNLMSEVDANTEIIRSGGRRIFDLVEINSCGQIYRLVNMTLWQKTRYAPFGIPDVSTDLQRYIKVVADELNSLNDVIRSAIHGVQPSLTEQFYDNQVEIDDTGMFDPMQWMTVLDFDKLLVEISYEIAKLPQSELNPANPRIDFLLQNILNNLLLRSEDILYLFQEDTIEKLDLSLSLSLDLLIVITIIGFVILSLIFKEVKDLLEKRAKFLEIFLRLDQKDISEGTRMAQHLLESLIKKTHIRNEKSILKKAKAKREVNVKKKLANYTGVNRPFIVSAILSLCWYLLFFFSFLTVFLVTKVNNNFFVSGVGLTLYMNQFLYNIDIQVWVIEEYIALNGTTTIRNIPIGQELETLYSQTLDSENFLLNIIIEKENSPDGAFIKTLILGDLCTLNNLEIDPGICQTIANGAAHQGIIGALGYIMKNIRTTKDDFDHSARNFEAQLQAFSLNTGPVAEMTTYMVLFPAYRTLEWTVYQDFVNQINSYPGYLLSILIGISMGLLILGTFLWINIWTRLDKERILWRRMVRHIPHSMIWTHKGLRNYLSLNSDVNLDILSAEISQNRQHIEIH